MMKNIKYDNKNLNDKEDFFTLRTLKFVHKDKFTRICKIIDVLFEQYCYDDGLTRNKVKKFINMINDCDDKILFDVVKKYPHSFEVLKYFIKSQKISNELLHDGHFSLGLICNINRIELLFGILNSYFEPHSVFEEENLNCEIDIILCRIEEVYHEKLSEKQNEVKFDIELFVRNKDLQNYIKKMLGMNK